MKLFHTVRYVQLSLFLFAFCTSMNAFSAMSGKVTIRGKITSFDQETVTIRDFEGKTWTVQRSALNKKLNENVNTDRTVVVKVRNENARWAKTR